MKYNRKKAFEMLKEFDEICTEKKIWYSADDHMLLGAFRHGGFVPWFEKMQVMMTSTSYRKLLRLMPKRIIDSSIIKGYRALQPVFVDDAAEWDAKKPFIEIRIVVPTTLKKIRKFKSFSRNCFYKILFKKNNLRNAIDDLFSCKNEGFYTISSRYSNTIKNWIPNLSFEVLTVKFGTCNIKVVKEHDKLLTNWFGENYMKAVVPPQFYNFPSPAVKFKEVL